MSKDRAQERALPAEVAETLRPYPVPLTSPRKGAIPNPPERREPVWLEPLHDFYRNAYAVAEFDERRRKALATRLHRTIQQAHVRLNESPMPGLPPASARKSVDRTCHRVCEALAPKQAYSGASAAC